MDASLAYGTVRVMKHDKKTGLLLFDETFKNQITNYARGQAAGLWAGLPIYTPNQISLGTGSPPSGQTGPTPDDTGLWSEIAGSKKKIDYATTWLQYYTQYSVTYLQTEAIETITGSNPNGAIQITECGLWDSYGQLWSHVQLSGVSHDNTSTLSIQWNILQLGN
jgi:hypothetical protein